MAYQALLAGGLWFANELGKSEDRKQYREDALKMRKEDLAFQASQRKDRAMEQTMAPFTGRGADTRIDKIAFNSMNDPNSANSYADAMKTGIAAYNMYNNDKAMSAQQGLLNSQAAYLDNKSAMSKKSKSMADLDAIVAAASSVVAEEAPEAAKENQAPDSRQIEGMPVLSADSDMPMGGQTQQQGMFDPTKQNMNRKSDFVWDMSMPEVEAYSRELKQKELQDKKKNENSWFNLF